MQKTCYQHGMTEREMFEASFQRPTSYFELSEDNQWNIDRILGILDWKGLDLSKEDKKRFKAHYNQALRATKK
jgi:hypothetical protein